MPVRLSALLFLAIALVAAAPSRAERPDGGQRMAVGDSLDRLSPELDRRMVEAVARNIETLRAQGRLPATRPQKVSGLTWPMGPFPGAGVDYHAISGFVDLNLAYPNQVRDYTCSNRSYDRADGYNHRGIDYVLWPFPWHLMDTGAIDVRAAAPGTLIEKSDGYGDRSCTWDGPGDMNYVIVLHADGTIARYLHMKAGSVTTRPIGAAIAAGEVLGKVGSSGISKLPHLHFELRSNNSVNAPVIEPHNGQCNAVASAWTSQRPYRDTRINRLSTHGALPVPAVCSGNTAGAEQPNFKNAFAPGDAITFVSAYRDVSPGQVTQFRVLRPDNSVFTTWNFDPDEDPGVTGAVSGAYWEWQNTLPGNAPHGLWTYEATLLGASQRHYFRVGSTTTPIADIRGLIGAWYEPATSGQGLELHWIDNDTVLVFFYGHRDNGENFYALGTRRGRFDYGQEIVIPLHRATGGRFNNFDPSLIARPAWGELRLTFASCTSAVAELEGTDGSKVLTLERLGRMPGLSCD